MSCARAVRDLISDLVDKLIQRHTTVDTSDFIANAVGPQEIAQLAMGPHNTQRNAVSRKLIAQLA